MSRGNSSPARQPSRPRPRCGNHRRILAAADACRAMSEPRSHRPALSLKQASDELRSVVRSGRLAADAVDVVLAAAGQHRARRRAGPSGLTPWQARPSSAWPPGSRIPRRSPSRSSSLSARQSRVAKKLSQASLISGAELQGTVPMWAWIGDEAATTFSY